MAITKSRISSALQLEVEKGISDSGQPIIGRITYKNIKADVTEQDMYDVALVLGGLQQHTLSTIQCIDYNDLTEAV